MAVFMLDTSVIIDSLNAKKGRTDYLMDLVQRQGHTLACCAITVAEVYAGMRPKEEQRTTLLLHSLELYPITFAVAELAGRLKSEHGKRGSTLSLTDTLIAAVAIHYELTLITDNVKDFPMKELRMLPLPG
jgi:predicted nucleic acid-binding protein